MGVKHRQPKLLMAPGRRAPDGNDMFEDYVQNPEGLWIYNEIFPVESPKGVIFMMHGLAEHMGRYKHVIKHLNAAGYACVMHDHQGHGRSEGERVHVASFDRYVEDFLLVMRNALKRNPSFNSLPRFVLGHSMGGMISCLAVVEMKRQGLDVDGLVLTSPFLAADPKTATPTMKKIAKNFSGCFPKLFVFWQKGPAHRHRISHDDAAQYRYETDPTMALGLRVGWGYECLCAIDKAQAEAKEITVPYLAMHAGDDGFVPMEGTEQWHAKTSSTDKTYMRVEGAFHEIMNETEGIRKKVLSDITAWLAKHTSGQAASRPPSGVTQSGLRENNMGNHAPPMGFPGGYPQGPPGPYSGYPGMFGPQGRV